MESLSGLKNNLLRNLKAALGIFPALLLVTTSSAYAYDSYQLKVLFTPTKSDLEAEAKGRVMIYDSLKNETVEKALDEQFWRIDKMMFIRTQYVQEDGDYKTEEEDCD